MAEVSSPRVAPIQQPDCDSPAVKKCPDFLPLYEAVAQMTASMEWIKNSIQENSRKIDELTDLRNVDHDVLTKMKENMKRLVGNGDSDLEPIIPRMQRKLDELDREQDHMKDMSLKIGFVTGGFGTAVGAIGMICFEYMKQKLGWK